MSDYELEDAIEEVIDEICSILPYGEGEALAAFEVRDYTVAIQNLVGSLLTLAEVKRLRFHVRAAEREEAREENRPSPASAQYLQTILVFGLRVLRVPIPAAKFTFAKR